MKTVFEACEPRPEVLRGELKEEIFAASLADVVEGRAEDVYQDPATFFDNTFPTEGLKAFVREALGRVTGKKPTSSPIIRLETSFGGGKTHSLIALYHLGRAVASPAMVGSIVEPELIPSQAVPIAAVSGADLDPNGLDHGNITTYTLWGELAYQLGGVDAYAKIEASDTSRIAPGTQALQNLLGDSPAIIMIDELPRYLRAAKGLTVGETTLAGQTIAFLLSLLEFAASKARVVVVYSLAGSADAFGTESDEIREAFAEAREAARISARQERVFAPTGETDICTIVAHRLFRRIDKNAAHDVAASYSSFYSQLISQGVELPVRAGGSDYAREIVAHYPFHPELLNTLNRKTATIPNFQRTRGALRLLAIAVRQLWEQQPPDTYLIHPHHLDLGTEDIANELTSRLERPRLLSVIQADIVSRLDGSRAHAQVIDKTWVAAGKPPYAQRIATTIFLHSLTQTVASGVDPADLLLAVLQPGDDPGLIDRALKRLLGEDREFTTAGTACWHLHWDGHRYRFSTEPSLEKIVRDEMDIVKRTEAKEELDRRIQQVWPKGHFTPVYFPSEAAQVDDDANRPKLVIIRYDAASTDATATSPPALVLKIFNHSGTMEGYRTYRNNLLFLVADRDQIEHMVTVARRYLAIRRIAGESNRMAEFNAEQQKKLKSMQEAAELEVRVAITRAYRFLYYPSADAPKRAGNLERVTLPPQEQGEVEKDQTAVLLRLLRELNKVLTGDDSPLAAPFVKAKAWPQNQGSISTEDLRRAFAQRLGLPMVLDINQLKKTIRDGVKNGTWVYYDAKEGFGYGQTSPAPLVQFSEDTILYTPEEARRTGIKIKGEEKVTCPVCGRPEDECECGQACKMCGQSPCVCERVPATLRAEGAPAEVFQAIADQCYDRRIPAVKQLIVKIEGRGKEGARDARALGQAIPQLGRGDFFVEQSMAAEFGTSESLEIRFSGSWDRYRRVKQLTDTLANEASSLDVKMTLRADFQEGLPIAGDQYQTIRDVFTALELGRLVVEATPADEAQEEEYHESQGANQEGTTGVGHD